MKPDMLWKTAFVCAITLARISQGMYLSLVGPTLLYLADNLNVEVTQASIIFTARSIGAIAGALLYALVANRFPRFSPLHTFAPSVALNGLMVLITPWLTNIEGFVVANLVAGITFGFPDGGMQTMYLRIWGEEGSRPFIQSFHFGIGVGALLAPIIAGPFLEMADEASSGDTSCPESSPVYQQTPVDNWTTTTYAEFMTTPGDTFNPVGWSYVAVGAASVAIAIPLLIFPICGFEGRIQMFDYDKESKRNEEPFRDVWGILSLLFLFYFFIDMLETTFSSFIYSVPLCSELGFTVSQATSINSLYWIGYLSSRGLAIIYSNFFQPTTIIYYIITCAMTSMILICIFGEQIPLVMWIASTFYAVSVAPLYSTGVTWASNVTDVSGTYMFVFLVGSGVSGIFMLPAAAALFDLYPFYVMYLIVGASFAIGLVFLLLEFVVRRRKLGISKEHKADLSHANTAHLCIDGDEWTISKL